MFPAQLLGYLPAYGPHGTRKFTKLFPERVVVSFDTVNTDPTADYRVLVQCEPPKLYIKFKDMVYENYQKFNLILTYDDRLLQLPNAEKFLPVSSWINDLPLQKTNQVSYVMSSKILTGEHRMRFMILRRVERLKKLGEFDFIMHRSPPRVPSKEQFFIHAKFNIACENQCMTHMFTEKLLDCFRSRTVPIYYGCTNIEQYFNVMGMLRFNSIEEFDRITQIITPDLYDRMQPYIEENYQRAKPYWEQDVYQRIESIIENKLLTLR